MNNIKHTIIQLLIAVVLITIALPSIAAEQNKNFKWSQSGISFSAPSDMAVSESTKDLFSGESELFGIEAERLSDFSGVAQDKYKEYLNNKIKELFDTGNTKIQSLDLTGLTGYYAELPIGDEIDFFVILLVDNSTGDGFLFRLAINGDHRKSSKAILNSFTKE